MAPTPPAVAGEVKTAKGRLVHETVDCPALKGNLLETPSKRSVSIYLPPRYRTSPERRYPTVYLLHGTTSTNKDFTGLTDKSYNIEPELNRLIAAGKLREMIVVVPDTRTKLGGAFYTNSTVTGKWEDFLVVDLVKHVDRTYRTLARPESRAVVGHSMGGYGALKVAMKHPDVFRVAYAMSPPCLNWSGDLGADNPAWRKTLALKHPDELPKASFYALAFTAMATSFSPNPKHPPFLADWPFEATGDGLRINKPAHDRWSAHFLVSLAEKHRDNLKKLRAVRFDVGKSDEFSSILLGCRALSQSLTRLGVPHTFEEYEGGHNDRIWARLWSKVLPCCSETLSFAK
jgi:S-formylglutathione hydrolase FrmB